MGDTTRFVEESLGDLLAVATAASHLADGVRDVSEVAGLVAAYNVAAGRADIEFISEEVRGAIEESLEGLDHVASLVKALKAFAHPGSAEKAPEDLNEVITTTTAVARNEWKCVAQMDLSGLDAALPKVPLLSGPLKQVLLNMIVNAAQAIEDTDQNGDKGTISISTRTEGDSAVIEIADTGCGIPESIQERILEPFFTTKDVGRGSGQGLTIANPSLSTTTPARCPSAAPPRGNHLPHRTAISHGPRRRRQLTRPRPPGRVFSAVEGSHALCRW